MRDGYLLYEARFVGSSTFFYSCLLFFSIKQALGLCTSSFLGAELL